MKNRKSTKRALVLSVCSIALCMVMLVGTTFAWFTDTASTAVNTIQSGILDIELQKEVNGDWVDVGTEPLEFVKAEGAPENEAVLWEPGCEYRLPKLRILNKSNLALKYKVLISGINGDAELNDVIDWTIDGVAIDTELHMLPTQTEQVFTISGKMQETAGNEYQNKTIEGVTITVVATQDAVEHDSYNNTYDANAEYPDVPVTLSRDKLNTELTLDDLKDETGKAAPVEVSLGEVAAEDIAYSENNSGYTGKGVLLGSTKLNKYNAKPAAAGEYKFTFKDGTINSAATGYASIDSFKDTSVYMLVPGNSDVVFENMTFNGVVSFDIQKYTGPWSNLNSITFKNCIFNGIIIGTCPASNVTFDGCRFNAYTNTEKANNSNPIWWREDTEGSGANANPIKTFTFVNNTVVGTRPVKIERVGKTVSPVFTIKNNHFDITSQTDDGSVTKNMAINIGMGENPNLPFTLIDEGNVISANTAALYTASLTGGSNWYKEMPGMKVLDGSGKDKVITAMVWKTTTGETFELKTVN